MANDLTGQNIQDSYKRILTVGDDGLMYDGTGSLYTPLSASHEITTELSSSHAINADTASFATDFEVSNTGSFAYVSSSKVLVTSVLCDGSYRLDDSGGTSRHIIVENSNFISLGNTNFGGINLTGSLTTNGSGDFPLGLTTSRNIVAGAHITASGGILAHTLTGIIDGGTF
jgi:hypothetical protein